MSCRILAAASLSLLATLASVSAETRTINEPNILYDGPVVAESVSVADGFNAPRLTPITANETSYDWWYFDAVSAASNASATVVFYDGGPKGFINTYQSGPYSVTVTGTWANGTFWNFTIDTAGGLSMVYGPGDNVFGHWRPAQNGTSADKAQFVHTALTTLSVVVDAPNLGVTGTLRLTSVTPPHYPCGPAVAGQPEVMVPHVWWANAVPDATAEVDLVINGEPLQFADGVGYHDKNWGDATFTEAVSSWYWGHARVGPYSIVWFDAIDRSGDEHTSGYVAEGDDLLVNTCTLNATAVRPWGNNSDYPPRLASGVMQGLDVRFTLANGSVFAANVTTDTLVVDTGVYVRTIGTVEGGFVDGATYTGGRAHFEEFKFD